MRIYIKRDRLVVYGFFGLWKRFDCSPDKIEELAVMADYDHYGLRALPWRADYNELRLRFVMIRSSRNITLDAFSDRGFDRALTWFKESGWEMDIAIRQALEIPRIRVFVSKSQLS